MRMFAHVSLVIILSFIRFVCLEQLTRRFTVENGYKNAGPAISSEKTLSMIHCIRVCLDDTDCQAVVYEIASQMCSFLSSTTEALESNSGTTGYMYISVGNQDTIVQIADQGVEERCPDGWIQFQSSCYLSPSGQFNWDNSQIYCGDRNAYLAEIETAEENAFIIDFVKNTSRYGHWLGLSDIETEGVWKWMSSGSTVAYFDWDVSEPSTSISSNCAGIFMFDYKWADQWCTDMYYPLCEKGQNKNKFVLGYFMWRTMTGQHEKIEYHMQGPAAK